MARTAGLTMDDSPNNDVEELAADSPVPQSPALSRSSTVSDNDGSGQQRHSYTVAAGERATTAGLLAEEEKSEAESLDTEASGPAKRRKTPPHSNAKKTRLSAPSGRRRTSGGIL